jgi:hypothetical protein
MSKPFAELKQRQFEEIDDVKPVASETVIYGSNTSRYSSTRAPLQAHESANPGLRKDVEAEIAELQRAKSILSK